MKNNNIIDVRFYQPGDDKQIVELLKKTFPKWFKFKDPMGLWRWKYIDTPNKSLISIALSDDKIIGCDHTIVFDAKLGSELTKLAWADDLAVDSDFRGLGVWKKMAALRDEKITTNLAKYSYSTTINPIVNNSWKKSNI